MKRVRHHQSQRHGRNDKSEVIFYVTNASRSNGVTLTDKYRKAGHASPALSPAVQGDERQHPIRPRARYEAAHDSRSCGLTLKQVEATPPLRSSSAVILRGSRCPQPRFSSSNVFRRVMLGICRMCLSASTAGSTPSQLALGNQAGAGHLSKQCIGTARSVLDCGVWV